MDLFKLSKIELLKKCEEFGFTKYKSKNKIDLINLINSKIDIEENLINSKINIEEKSFNFIDLFCGIGGFHQALSQLNGKCVFACDKDEKCCEIYYKNYGIKPYNDITTIDVKDIPDFDVLTAGFPCQTFSNAGKKKGFNDKRGILFEHILRIATFKKPKFMFLENVKHIKNIENGVIFKHILNRINESEYVINEKLVFELSPHQLGIPQQRERVIFVCIRKDIYDSNKNIIINPPKIQINLSNFFEKNVDKKYNISDEVIQLFKVWDEMIKIFEIGEKISPTILCNEFNKVYLDNEFNNLPKWKQDYITKNKRLYNKYKTEWDEWYNKNSQILQKKEIYGKLEWQTGVKKENDSIFNYFIQLRQSGIRIKKANYFPTLVAIVQTPIYAKENRYITPRECARLQSFPENFIINNNDQTAYKQFGNAVNVKVVHYVINETLKVYNIY